MLCEFHFDGKNHDVSVTVHKGPGPCCMSTTPAAPISSYTHTPLQMQTHSAPHTLPPAIPQTCQVCSSSGSSHLFFPTFGTQSPQLPTGLIPFSWPCLHAAPPKRNTLFHLPHLAFLKFLHIAYYHLTHYISLIYLLVICFPPRM